MKSNLPPLKPLRAFEAAARHGSFKSAAEELLVTQGAISYQIQNLESWLGVRLFKRETRRVSLTPQGDQFFRAVTNAFKTIAEGVGQIQPAKRTGILTVSVSTFFATRWLSQRLGRFMNQYPGITVRLQHSVNDPDFSVDDVDLAVRWGRGKWRDCHANLLFDSPMVALCSPDLITGESSSASRLQLKDQIFLHDQPGNDSWKEWLEIAGHPEMEGGTGPLITDPNVRVQSAIDGHGMVLANRLLAPEIAEKLLVEPFPIRLEGMGFYLVHQKGAPVVDAVERFKEWILREAAEAELPEI